MLNRILSAQLTLGLLLRALLLGGALLALLASGVQAQAPNSGISIDGLLTMKRTDGPQIQFNDTRFPDRGPAVTMRGASGSSIGMLLIERAGGRGATNVVVQPVGAMQPGTSGGFIAYGVGGLGNPISTNFTIAYSNVDPPFYILGTSTAGGASPCAPIRLWNMNHTALTFECAVNNVSIVRLSDALVWDDAQLATADPTIHGFVMSRLVRATADHGGLSWPIDFSAPIFDGQGQQLRNIRMQAFGENTDGANAAYGLRFTDNDGNVLMEIRNAGVFVRNGGVLRQVGN